MKWFVIKTVTLFFLSVFVANAHRVLNASRIEMLHPFIARPEIPISRHWYYLFLGDLISYSFVWLWVCFTLNPIQRHLQDIKWAGTNPYLVFVTLWHNIFWVCFFASILDIAHFLIGFKTIDWWFVVQNSVFLIISIYFICKSYFKRWLRKKT